MSQQSCAKPEPSGMKQQVLDSKTKGRIDLLRRFPALGPVLKHRWFQFALIFPNLVLFALFLVAGIYGTPVGNRNIIIVFVWIVWWFLLIALMVPFASRIWCAMCPFPFIGEWAQRGALVSAKVGKAVGRWSGLSRVIGKNRYFGFNIRWPKALSNIWMQNIGFLGLCTFSALFLTRPIISTWVLGSLVVLATVLHVIFRQRAFCNYVCPVSGFLSLYSMTSKLEVRSRDSDVCLKCKTKSCLAGSETGWGCPWSMYPSKMDRNNYCGVCTECITTCPHDNMTINLRPFGSDTKMKGYDEAWKAFIMLTLVATYSVLYLGPWGFLRDWANAPESNEWGGFGVYVSFMWTTALLFVPGVFALAAWAGGKWAKSETVSFKKQFLAFAYTLVPFGLLIWIAFSTVLVFTNWSYIANVVSDPFGWGWDLFGTGSVEWRPFMSEYVVFLQMVLVAVGLYFALKSGWKAALGLHEQPKVALRAFLPTGFLLSALAILFIVLYAG